MVGAVSFSPYVNSYQYTGGYAGDGHPLRICRFRQERERLREKE